METIHVVFNIFWRIKTAKINFKIMLWYFDEFLKQNHIDLVFFIITCWGLHRRWNYSHSRLQDFQNGFRWWHVDYPHRLFHHH